MNYEDLLIEAESHQLSVKEKEFKEFDGLIVGHKIGIRKDIETSTEKACILAEELGHHFTSSGNIVFLETQSDRKQERIARGWAYDKMIGLLGIVSAFERRCMNSYEMAEYLGVTEEFLKDALEYYKQKYGTGAKYGQYWITFTPSLMVAKIY